MTLAPPPRPCLTPQLDGVPFCLPCLLRHASSVPSSHLVSSSHLVPRLCSWSRYTLDGAASLSPPPGVPPSDPLAWPAQHLLDLTASDVGITTRYDLAPALASLTVQSKGFFYGARSAGTAGYHVRAPLAGPRARRCVSENRFHSCV